MKAPLLGLLAVAVFATAVAAAHPAGARAAHGVEYGLTDDAWLTNGPGTVDSRLDKLDALGVKVVRFTLEWSAIAATRPTQPSDPADTAYDWSGADAVLEGLHAHGEREAEEASSEDRPRTPELSQTAVIADAS